MHVACKLKKMSDTLLDFIEATEGDYQKQPDNKMTNSWRKNTTLRTITTRDIMYYTVATNYINKAVRFLYQTPILFVGQKHYRHKMSLQYAACLRNNMTKGKNINHTK